MQGQPFTGRLGEQLIKQMQRGGMNLDDFRVTNVLSCAPPKGQLDGQWYMREVVDHCRPNLDAEVNAFKPKCIVALGNTAMRWFIPDMPVDIIKAMGYVFWSDRYQTWVLPTIQPSWIIRGKTAYAQCLIHSLQRAVEIAQHGYAYDTFDYTLDCTPAEAHKWVDEFEVYAVDHTDLYLSTDIETPGKDADEEDLDLEDGSDYVILRCGYSYKKGHALSIPWGGPFQQVHERLLKNQSQKLWWNSSYDVPRILSQGITINGTSHDGLDAWHVLNSDLKKSLGFVTPFFYHGMPMWKHSSSRQPAWYNAADADAAGVNMRGTVELLKKHGMWQVYNEYICELDPVFSTMTRAGMPVDKAIRIQSAKLLGEKRDVVRQKIESVVPKEVKAFSPKAGYIREPQDKTGLSQIVLNGVRKEYCSSCGLEAPKKAHFKARQGKFCSICGGKYTPTHVKPKRNGNNCETAGCVLRELNACATATVEVRLEGETRWARLLPFVTSTKNILKYQQFRKHPIITVGKGEDRKVTTDIKAINKLIGKYPDDHLYPLVKLDRELTKIGGTYVGWWDTNTRGIVGGFPTGRDNCIHGVYRHSPSTLRASMVSPNLMNIPRGDDSEVQQLVKQMFVAPVGFTFVERDLSGVEAVLVGYHANSRDYIRLARTDVHSYFTAYNLRRMGILTDADLPQLSWSDSDLAGCLAGIKKRFKVERNIGKRCIHAGNYRVGPKVLHEAYPEWFHRIKDAATVLRFYYELFPAIDKWHERICLQVDKSAVVRNSFGHVHRFYQVLAWEKINGDWKWTYSDDSKRLIAFLPQSDAAFIAKRALKRLYYNYPDTVAHWLRLFIHDSIICEVPKAQADWCEEMLKLEMETPIPEMRIDPAWGYGEYLNIQSEGKQGDSWGSMDEKQSIDRRSR